MASCTSLPGSATSATIDWEGGLPGGIIPCCAQHWIALDEEGEMLGVGTQCDQCNRGSVHPLSDWLDRACTKGSALPILLQCSVCDTWSWRGHACRMGMSTRHQAWSAQAQQAAPAHLREVLPSHHAQLGCLHLHQEPLRVQGGIERGGDETRT